MSFTFGVKQRTFSLGPSRANITVCYIDDDKHLEEFPGQVAWGHDWFVEDGSTKVKKFSELPRNDWELLFKELVNKVTSNNWKTFGLRFPMYHTIHGITDFN